MVKKRTGKIPRISQNNTFSFSLVHMHRQQQKILHTLGMFFPKSWWLFSQHPTSSFTLRLVQHRFAQFFDAMTAALDAVNGDLRMHLEWQMWAIGERI